MRALTLLSLLRLGCYFIVDDILYLYRWHRKVLICSLLIITVCAIIFIEVNWYRTKYSIQTSKAGEITTYKHSHDERTNGIISYLTGRGPLPESERLPLYRQYVKNRLEEAKMPVPENFYTLKWDGVNALAIEWYKKKYPSYPRDKATLDRIIEKLFKNAIKPPLEGFTPNVHDNLWRLLEKVGSPRIRWVEEQDDNFSRWIVVNGQSDKQAFYNPINNTIYIRYKDAVTNLLDEVGHAQQFRQHPLTSYRKVGLSMLTAWIGSEFDTKISVTIYKFRYVSPNTFEGEAHGRIKEELLQESGLITVKETAPPKT